MRKALSSARFEFLEFVARQDDRFRFRDHAAAFALASRSGWISNRFLLPVRLR